MTQTIRLGVVMDPIASINAKKDSTLAMLWEAQARGWLIYYFEQANLFSRKEMVWGDARIIKVSHDLSNYVAFQNQQTIALNELDIILMRKDPPFNQQYIETTYFLEQAERLGVRVVNRPQALRDLNEKFSVLYFPQCIPTSLVTCSIEKLREFQREYRDIVCKPLDSMGGTAVFRVQENEVNAPVIFETLTQGGTRYIMAQQFIPEIKKGDKRILLINGRPVSHALARIPQGDDWRGNLAVGAKPSVQPLTNRDHFICEQVGPFLRERGIYFAGIDVIGDYLTEINITSPTGIRELDAALDMNISAMLLDAVM